MCQRIPHRDHAMPLATSTVLVIDDDPAIALLVREAIHDSEVRLFSAGTLKEGLTLVARHRPDLVVLDVILPDGTGLDLYPKLKEFDAKLPVLFVATRGTSHTAIEAMRLGAFDFLTKPLDLSDLRRLYQQAIEIRRLMRVPVEIRETVDRQPGGTDVLIGRSPAMQEAYKAIGRMATRDLPVLVRGETGTGKQLVARALYSYSSRAAGPFLTVQCGVDEHALEAELFGHEGRDARGGKPRAGKVEQAAGGTLFLDEIGELTPTLQSMILNLIEERLFHRIGCTIERSTDVRLVVATRHNLEQLVAQGRFRPDLFYRLSQCMIRIPSLRDRPEDLPALVQHILGRSESLIAGRPCRISPEALELLRRHPWPGNVRELESALNHAIARSNGAPLIPEFFDEFMHSGVTLPQTPGEGGIAHTDWHLFLSSRLGAGSHDVYAQATAEMDRQVLTHVLRYTEGNQARAASLLGMTRSSLRAKIRALGIVIDRLVNLSSDGEHSSLATDGSQD